MQKTENLELNIIDGTDVPSHAVFNENFNKLDVFAKNTNDKLTNTSLKIETINNNIEQLGEVNNTQNESISSLGTDLEDVKNDVTVLEDKIKKVEFTENGETKTGELHTVKLELTPTYSDEEYFVKEYGKTEEQNRIAIGVSTSYATINLTNLLNVRAVDEVDVLSCSSYAKGYYNYGGYTNPIQLQTRTLAVVTPTGESSIKLELQGNFVNVVRQTYSSVASGIGVWNPATVIKAQQGKVTIVLQAIIYK